MTVLENVLLGARASGRRVSSQVPCSVLRTIARSARCASGAARSCTTSVSRPSRTAGRRPALSDPEARRDRTGPGGEAEAPVAGRAGRRAHPWRGGGVRRPRRRLRETYGLTVLLVEHHMGLVMTLCSRLVVLHLGRNLAEGTPARSGKTRRSSAHTWEGHDHARRRTSGRGIWIVAGPARRRLMVEEGSIVALLGSNGAGKTTTLRALAGTIPSKGRITSTAVRWPDHPALGPSLASPTFRKVAVRSSISQSRRISCSARAPSDRARRSQWTWIAGTRAFRDCASAAASQPGRSAAASSRCWRSPER